MNKLFYFPLFSSWQIRVIEKYFFLLHNEARRQEKTGQLVSLFLKPSLGGLSLGRPLLIIKLLLVSDVNPPFVMVK
jgi:hypothetical protein